MIPRIDFADIRVLLRNADTDKDTRILYFVTKQAADTKKEELPPSE